MLESVIMQASGVVVTSQSPVESIVAIIIAIGAIATTLGHFMSSNQRFAKYGQYLTNFGQKTVEQEKNIAGIGEAITAISPDAKALLEKYSLQLEELRRRAEIAEAQLSVLSPKIPEKAQADNITNLPR